MDRLFKHAFTGRWHVRQLLKGSASSEITRAVTAAEQGHSGQIRVVIEGTPGLHHVLQGRTARQRALQIFGEELVWDTERNNGVLLYLMVAERDAQIIADRGLNGKVSGEQWEDLCLALEKRVEKSGFVQAVCHTVGGIGALLREHFGGAADHNELPDEVLIRK